MRKFAWALYTYSQGVLSIVANQCRWNSNPNVTPEISLFKRAFLSNIPILFVLLWSTGFIGAKYGLLYAEPYTLLFYRFVLTLVLLVMLLAYFKPLFPSGWRQRFHLMLTGSLIHGAYLGGVFSAIKLGMPAGLCALIVGLQPLLTTLSAPLLLGERISRPQWVGILFGLLGLYLILETGDGQIAPLSRQAILAAFIALGGITAGTVYQKKFCANNALLSSVFFQYISTVAIFGAGSLFFETGKVVPTPQLFFSILWLAIGLSIGAILLLTYLIKHGEVHTVSSLFYLVPAATALEASWFFDEKLGVGKVVGMAIVAVSVFMVVHRAGPANNKRGR